MYVGSVSFAYISTVGYSTCHWCHVMERESFENADIGKIMNEHYVSIKVDREERPDVDRVYMTFIQVNVLSRSPPPPPTPTRFWCPGRGPFFSSSSFSFSFLLACLSERLVMYEDTRVWKIDPKFLRKEWKKWMVFINMHMLMFNFPFILITHICYQFSLIVTGIDLVSPFEESSGFISRGP